LAEGDLTSLKVVDFGNAIHCTHEELSLYYEDFELQALIYRAPEVIEDFYKSVWYGSRMREYLHLDSSFIST